MSTDEVSAIIRRVGAAEVVPRFQALADDDVIEKSPGDLVTIADRECERVLATRLRQVREIPVVGEEGTSANPALLDLVATAPAVWLIDPIDGTSNFVAGNSDFVVMVALVEAGQATSAWVWHPHSDDMTVAERGRGVRRNGARISAAVRGHTPRGVLKRKYMPEPARSVLAHMEPAVAQLAPAPGSAGVEYGQLVDGTIDFLMYWRTLPWDHAPGALIAEEAGLHVARLDGSDYEPGDGRTGLLAASPALWPTIASVISSALESNDA